MLQEEHSAKLSTYIKLSFVIKIIVLSIFEWPFYTGFTVPGPRREKTCLRGFRQSEIQTSLLSYRDNLEIEISRVASLHMKFSKERITKALIRHKEIIYYLLIKYGYMNEINDKRVKHLLRIVLLIPHCLAQARY